MITWEVMFPELFSNVCVCVRACMCMHTCLHTHVSTHTCPHTCAHMCVWMSVCEEQNFSLPQEQVQAQCVMPPVPLYSKCLHGLSWRSFNSNQGRDDLGGAPSPTGMKERWACTRPPGPTQPTYSSLGNLACVYQLVLPEGVPVSLRHLITPTRTQC